MVRFHVHPPNLVYNFGSMENTNIKKIVKATTIVLVIIIWLGLRTIISRNYNSAEINNNLTYYYAGVGLIYFILTFLNFKFKNGTIYQFISISVLILSLLALFLVNNHGSW